MSFTVNDDENCDPVLLSTFVIEKINCHVVFHKGTLTWETLSGAFTRWIVSLRDVIGVHYIHNADRNRCCGSQTQAEPVDVKLAVVESSGPQSSESIPQGHSSFTLHYIQKGKHNKLEHATTVFKHSDSRQVASWVKTLRNCIAGIEGRPKSILLFVNPFGGKKRGIKIYERQVKPLFEISGIKTHVVVTERMNHARDMLLEMNLDGFDGIACIGGDGTFAEVFNGLLLRTAADNDINPNNPETNIPTPQLRVGVIPGGSTDTMAYCFHGTIQVQTAILHIILGDSTGLDLCSVHNNTSLLRYYSSVISYGFLGDVMVDSEKFRWMGPKRYDYSGFKTFLINKGYEGEVSVLADTSDASIGPKCREECIRCGNQAEIKRNKEGQNGSGENVVNVPELKTFRGKYFMVSGANVSCACVQSPNGLSPNCHLGDGCVDVLLIKHTHWVNTLRLLLTLNSKRKNVFALPFVEVHRAKEFTFRPVTSGRTTNSAESNRTNPEVSVWNCDGEIQWETTIRIRAHCQLINVFTRRMAEEEHQTCWQSCTS